MGDPRSSPTGWRWSGAAIGAMAVAAFALTAAASRSTSATFDEIILVAGGVRGLETGRWDMVTDQPPLMMYLYGAAARGAVDRLPSEDREWGFDQRWEYARALHFGLGNDHERMLRRARTVGALLAALLVVGAGLLAWWVAGPLAGALASALTLLVPDVLAHGGVAYNDLPLAGAFLVAVWATDAWVRRPSPVRAAGSGLAVAVTFGMKLSALALVPVAGLLLLAEAVERWKDDGWRRALLLTVPVGIAALYVALVVLYRGDPSLTLLRFNFWRTVLHASGGHEAPAYLLGHTSVGGWWYYFPIAFLLKTPAAFQALLAIGVGALVVGVRAAPEPFRRAVAWRGRSAAVGIVVFGAFLLRSDLNAGFRYALPVLPLLAVVAAAGLGARWPCCRRAKAGVVGGLVMLQAVTVLSVFPHLLSYTSVWAGGRDGAYRVLADSNIDWGQGLLELRHFMERERVASVRLSYFGSAPPEAYGIEYVALPSFFRLSVPRTGGAEAEPRFTVVSATNLLGLYLQGEDPFEPYRDRVPYAVLGHSLVVYDEGG